MNTDTNAPVGHPKTADDEARKLINRLAEIISGDSDCSDGEVNEIFLTFSNNASITKICKEAYKKHLSGEPVEGSLGTIVHAEIQSGKINLNYILMYVTFTCDGVSHKKFEEILSRPDPALAETHTALAATEDIGPKDLGIWFSNRG